jgi:hypothetical protein
MQSPPGSAAAIRGGVPSGVVSAHRETIFADEIKIDFTSIFGGEPEWTHMSPDVWISFGSDFIGQFESTETRSAISTEPALPDPS